MVIGPYFVVYGCEGGGIVEDTSYNFQKQWLNWKNRSRETIKSITQDILAKVWDECTI